MQAAGEWSRAIEIWERIAAGGGYPGVCEELAKYHEHKSRRWDEALRRAEEGLNLLSSQGGSLRRCEEFRRRIVRLRGKLHVQV